MNIMRLKQLEELKYENSIKNKKKFQKEIVMGNKKFILQERKYEIEIIRKDGNYAVIANIWIDGIQVLESGRADICLFTHRPDKIYLKFAYANNGYTEYAVCICDRTIDYNPNRSAEEVEKNRSLCDFLYENIFQRDKFLPISEFTTFHWQNWEQEQELQVNKCFQLKK